MEKNTLLRMMDFIRNHPSPYHVTEGFATALQARGYERLSARERWEPVPGGKYFVTRGGASLIAFRMPEDEGPRRGFRISAAHSDSPTFRLKPNGVLADRNYLRLNTEKYGGMLMATWFDRPLSLAGRVLLREGEGIASRTVALDRDLLVIPSLAIHMDREANEGKKYRANVDTLPLMASGNGDKAMLNRLIAEAAGAAEENILDTELSLWCRSEPTVFGAAEEFILAPRLDDLECAWGCMEGFLAAEKDGTPEGTVPVCCIFHNEEVGSATKQGAGSSFLRDTLRRLCLAAGGDEEEFQTMLAGSFLVSADNAHAVHPNHPELSDGENCPVMNGGVVIKYNANQRYATDAASGAVFRSVCAGAEVPVQVFANRSDLAGGSTLGSIADTLLPVPTVDIGLAQLAMHAAVETAGAADPAHLVRAMTAYYGGTLPPVEED